MVCIWFYGDFYIITIPIYDKPYTYQTLVLLLLGGSHNFLENY